jgi:peptidyl-prolyl cis-trans isomerase C
VLKVEDRRPEQPISFETARPQIVRFLTYDEVRELLERLRNRATIKTLIGQPIEVPGAPTEPASAPKTPPAAAPSATAPSSTKPETAK